MTTRAYVEFRPELQGYRLPIVREGGGITTAVQFARVDSRTVTNEAAFPESMGWLTLSEDETRALYDALRREFEPEIEQRASAALRADYDAERTRVDKLTDAVISIAAGGTS